MDRRAPAADADVEHVHVVEIANQYTEYGFLGRLQMRFPRVIIDDTRPFPYLVLIHSVLPIPLSL